LQEVRPLQEAAARLKEKLNARSKKESKAEPAFTRLYMFFGGR
jgi:hypothetical protein